MENQPAGRAIGFWAVVDAHPLAFTIVCISGFWAMRAIAKMLFRRPRNKHKKDDNESDDDDENMVEANQ